jgi:uracil-DNA glycosylase
MDHSNLPLSWSEFLRPHVDFTQLATLLAALDLERRTQSILPERGDLFTAFHLTPPESVRIVVLGQDPYPTPGHAHGLAFSVRPGTPIPASLRNIFQELKSDLGFEPPGHGHLEMWATQGVLLLNTVLTVIAGQASSHRGRGWELLTDGIIRAIAGQTRPVIFWLWGKDAQKKRNLIGPPHNIIESAHPSPLSARTGFFGSRPFSKTNALLAERREATIDWRLN